MSPISHAIESLAERYRVNPLVAQEIWAERAAIRQYEGGLSREEAELAAIGDLESVLAGVRQ